MSLIEKDKVTEDTTFCYRCVHYVPDQMVPMYDHCGATSITYVSLVTGRQHSTQGSWCTLLNRDGNCENYKEKEPCSKQQS
jgi:hypothetical protein